jgi:type VI secretion system protein ImpI
VPITLRIDNFDQLPDGGPIEFSAGARGFDIGREQHMDWTLPDPNRVISGHHIQIRFENGAYWLHDVSRNGTMVNGAPGRVQSPYRLNNGDRLQIGHYFVRVTISGGPGDLQPMAQPSYQPAYAPPPPGGDIWGVEAAAAPVDRRQFVDQRRGQRAPDVLEQFLDLPGAGPRRGPAPGYDPGMATSVGLQQVGGSQIYEQRPAGASPFGGTMGGPIGAPSTAFPGQAPMPNPGGFAQPQPQVGPGGGASAFIAQIAQAAGISPQALAGRNQAELAQEIGQILALTTEQLIALLKTRAVAKLIAKSSTRTMLGPANNNPLKFVPEAREAAEIMLSRSRPGYLTAPQAIKEAFDNIKSHEGATFSAMQTALLKLTEEFDPDKIDAEAGGGLNKKAKAWDIFVELWSEKADNSDNGILDAFMKYFAEAYDAASKG